jgi:DNA-binding NarL/FixJ family response regulator
MSDPHSMRILLICGDKRIAASTRTTLAEIGIDAVDGSGAVEEVQRRNAQADALVIWNRQLRRMTRRWPQEIAWLGRRMPLIVALGLEETGSLADTAHLVNGVVFPEINLRRLAAIVQVARSGYLLLPDTIDGAALKRCALHPSGRHRITALENDVLEALAEGLTNRQISRRLELTDSAVKRLVHDALRKLHFENRTQAALYARFDRQN